jgi:hypothetical protein
MGRPRTRPVVKCGKCGKDSTEDVKKTRNPSVGNKRWRKYIYWIHLDKKNYPKSHVKGPLGKNHPYRTEEIQMQYWEEREPKILTPKPKPGESRMYHASAEVSNSLLKLGQDWKQLTEKIKQFPPNDTLFDRRVMVRLHQLKRVIDDLDSYVRWLADERLTNSIFEWIIIQMNQEYNPIRAKNSTIMDQVRAGFGLPAVTTEHNKMTKKGINKNQKKMDKRINDVVDSLKGFQLLKNIVFDLSLWRDSKSEFPNAIKGHKDSLRGKLRDSSIWRQDSEGAEHSGSFTIDELKPKNRKDKKSKIMDE